MPRKKQTLERTDARLSEAEEDLVEHLKQGYQLETDTLGSDPVLRRPKDDEVLRLASANRNTVKALEERDLIIQGKSTDPLRILWRLKGKEKK